MIQDKKILFIAEIGATHVGNIDRAMFLIDECKKAGVDYVKFQKRNPIESTPISLRDKPHPNPEFSYGKTYLEHRINLEFNIEQHRFLKEYCEKQGVKYSCSVWDLTSIKEIISLNPDFIKIPSALNRNMELIDYIYNNYNGQVHISTGMLNLPDFNNLISYLYGKKERTVIYHCTSIYPCPPDKLYLKQIDVLSKIFQNVGFSNHSNEIYSDFMALSLGANVFERHVIDSVKFRHTDSKVSLEFNTVKNLIYNLNNMVSSLNYRPDDLESNEEKEKIKLSFS